MRTAQQQQGSSGLRREGGERGAGAGGGWPAGRIPRRPVLNKLSMPTVHWIIIYHSQVILCSMVCIWA